MELISTQEKQLMSEIIEHGYNHAANSFAAMTGQKVIIKTSDIEFCTKHDYLKDNYNHLTDLTVLQTDVIGQIPGSSYLIFNEEEKCTVSQMSLASFGSSAKLDDSVILLEIDNILSAAVITELSNALKVSIYGDVPQLFKLDDIHHFHSYMNESSNDYYILTHTHFVFENHKTISPLFIWKMDKTLIEFLNASHQSV